MKVHVLGPSRVDHGAASEPALARKPRALLAAMSLRLDSQVTADTLVDLVWGDRPPAGAHGTLHSYVADLRRALEPDRGPREKPAVLLTSDSGYRLRLDRASLDATWFADEVGASHRVLAPLSSQLSTGRTASWPDATTVAEHADRLELALAAWSGEAFADLGDHPDVLAERGSLQQLRVAAEEDRALALLALGEHGTVVAATEQATARHPLRERTWALHALALTRSGRQADALDALRRIRTVLADELGLDPGQELRDLEQAVLRQEPALGQWLDRAASNGAPASPVAPSRGPSRAAQRASRAPAPPWATVGREHEAGVLAGVLDHAESGTPAFATLVGEAGIGKSRLVDQLVQEATDRGFLVGVGRCSQDDGAPPLWPWRAVLRDLSVGEDEVATLLGGTPAAAGDNGAAAFRTWEALVAQVAGRAAEQPVLLVLDDLHWADEATLRALSHLVASAAPGVALALVTTRRPWPPPAGPLAELGEQLTRRHAQVLELTGLPVAECGRLVESVTEGRLDAEVVSAWHERTGGNPFFLVELARLGDPRTTEEGRVPDSLAQVIRSRISRLPQDTGELLVLSAALGTEFSLDVLAAVADRDAEEVDDLLEPARAAGVVRDLEHGTLRFDHALTRDAVAGGVSPTRLGRLHARIAHALDDDPVVASVVRPEERVSELARHWLAAGPTHVGRAWRAAQEAARQAGRSFAHQDAADWMRAALDAHRRDPLGSREERHGLLMERAVHAQQAAAWPIVVDCCFEAIALAREAGDPTRMAAAAAELTRNSIWTVHQWDEVFPDVIEDLRWAMHEVGDHDSRERCELMLALAVELYYEPSASAEIEALVDEGVLIARRLDRPELVWWATRAGCLALWTPAYADRRVELSEEGLEATREMYDETATAIAEACLAGALLEVGDLDGYQSHAPRAEAIARRRRLTYVQLAIGWVELNLAAMREDTAALQRRAADLLAVQSWVAGPSADFERVVVALNSAAWRDDIGSFVGPLLLAMESDPYEELGRDTLFLALARAGRVDDLRRLAVRPITHDRLNWGSSLTAACIAETAAALEDPEQAARARDLLMPCSGRMVVAGISIAFGPVDGYLAVAEAVAGDRASATEHADRAQAQAESWGFPAYITWLRRHRDRLGI